MAPTRRQLLGGLAGAMALAGCAGDSAGGNGSPTAMADDATVGVSTHDDYGEYLVGPDGLALYLFEQDTNGAAESACSGGCADAWPPLTVEDDPTAGDGVTAELTTFDREDGTSQVAAGGWPLYFYQQDSAAGDTNGQGANEVWWLVSPDGTKVTASAKRDGY